jgi:hypothetical protein
MQSTDNPTAILRQSNMTFSSSWPMTRRGSDQMPSKERSHSAKRSLMSIWKAPARRAQGASDRISTSTRLIPMMREYTVFNVDQCDSLPDRIITGKPPRKSSATAQAVKGTLGGFYVYKSRIEIIRGLSFPSADALLRIACCGRLPSASRATRP